MLPGDRLACLFVDALSVGSQFRQWPLHVTLVPWFRLASDSESLAHGLELALRNLAPFTVRAGSAAHFGPRKRLVRLLEASEELRTVEHKVRSYLHKKRAWLVDETTKRHYDFRPHVTARAEQQLGADAQLRVERLYIVEQKGDYKEIVSEVCIGKTAA
jgi:2'-5' RNA ligase